MGSVFLSFALECSHLPKNSILSAKRQFSARFSNCSNSLNFKDKINCNTTKQNDLKWRKTCTGLKSDLVLFNGPQTKYIRDSLYKHPVVTFLGRPFALPFPWASQKLNKCTQCNGECIVVNVRKGRCQYHAEVRPAPAPPRPRWSALTSDIGHVGGEEARTRTHWPTVTF